MAHSEPYGLAYDPRTVEHLRFIEAKYHSLIRKTIREQLSFEPDKETRNRKLLKRTTEFGARWELRFGPNNRFRALYRIRDDKQEVEILAIGIKERNRLLIGGEEIKL